MKMRIWQTPDGFTKGIIFELYSEEYFLIFSGKNTNLATKHVCQTNIRHLNGEEKRTALRIFGI